MSVTAAVEPDKLLKELRNLWRELGESDANGVLRACAMTLLVVVDEERDAQFVGETLASLMHEHPSRAIVVRLRRCEERVLEARVFAQCWMPFGRRQQICCEQIEFLASPSSLADVATVVRGLVVPDLPVILYSPTETLWTMPEFRTLLPLSQKLIVDSCGMPESARVIRMLSELPWPGGRKADLAWSRLTPWREAIAAIFEHPERRATAWELSEVRILYKAEGEPSAVYYLAGWFMHILGAAVRLKIAPGVGPEFAGIAHVTMVAPGFDAVLEITSPNTAEVTLNGESAQVIVFPEITENYALRQELAVAGRDAVFEDVLGLANLMQGAE